MTTKIVHFGSDTFNRVVALKNLGYYVDECHSLAELHASLVGMMPADAVAIAEHDETMSDHAISLVRAISAVPLILFKSGNHDRNSARFDLVVPSDSHADQWLSAIAELLSDSSQRNR
jgi:hypothetical protein